MISEFVKKNWILVLVGLVVIVFLFIFSNRTKEHSLENPVLPTVAVNSEELDIENKSSIMVDVKGEVHQPGVYEIDADARVNDVIKLAGGFTEQADPMPVNLAQKVHDEMTIIVPEIGDDLVVTGSIGTNRKVRINSATQAEIETLSGIGPSKAQAIIQYRDEHGLFVEIEDLLNVSGIGAKTLENIREDLQIP